MARLGFVTAMVATLLIATIGLSVYYQLNTQEANPRNAVVREALRVCTRDPGSSRYSMLTQWGTIFILSNSVIGNVTLPDEVGGLKLTVFSQAEIDAKAAAVGPFLYLVFDEVSVYEDTAFVSFHATGVFDSGAGWRVSLTRRDGVWVGEGGMFWIA